MSRRNNRIACGRLGASFPCFLRRAERRAPSAERRASSAAKEFSSGMGTEWRHLPYRSPLTLRGVGSCPRAWRTCDGRQHRERTGWGRGTLGPAGGVGRLEPTMLAPAPEQAAGVYSAGDVSEATAADKTALALTERARYMLNACPKNLTVLELYAHEHEAGWAPWPPSQAAEALGLGTKKRLPHDVPDSPLSARGVPTQSTGDPPGAGCGGSSGTRAAARFYSAMPRVQDPHDRREAARRLLAGEPPCTSGWHRPSRHPRAPRSPNAGGAGVGFAPGRSSKLAIL